MLTARSLYVFFRSLPALLALSVLAACGGGGGGDGGPNLQSIEISPATPSTPLGTSEQFTATGVYSDGTHEDITTMVTWASSNTTVATISNTSGSNGLATTVGTGTTSISALLDGQLASVTLTVTDATVASVQVNPASTTRPKGASGQFTATATYTDGTTHTVTSDATWTSSAPSVVTVSDASGTKGQAKAVGQGTATITAALDGYSGTSMVTITAAALESIAVTPTSASIPKGTKQQFKATASYSDGSTLDVTTQANWTSSNANASVSNASGSNGLATGSSVGSAQITATYSGQTASSTLTVTSAVLQSVAVTPASPSIPNGTTQQFNATASYSDGSTVDVTAQATWSSNSASASVSNTTGSNGLATGNSVGSAQITATYGGQNGSSTLTVTAAVLDSLSVTPTMPSIANGLSQQFTATGTYSDGTTKDLTTTVTWSSSTTSVASISNASGSNGLAQSQSVGSTTITALDPSSKLSAQATLDVTSATQTSLTVAPTSPTIANGSTLQFTATALFTDGSQQDVTTSANWTSSNTAVADIGNSSGNQGLAVSQSAGSTTIGASYGGYSASTPLTVTAATLTSIQVTPAQSHLAANYSLQYTATGVYSDNSTQDITQSVTWSTNSSATATISNASGSKGLASGVAAGVVTISAAQASMSGSTTLTVSSATLKSIAVTPTNPSIAKGTTQQFAATGTFSDNTTQDLTHQVSWTSGTTSVATIDASSGLATADGTGTSTITATSTAGGSSTSGNTTLTVTAATLTSISISGANGASSVPKGSTLQFTATGTYSDGTTQNITASVTWSSSDTSIATITNTSSGISGSTTGGVATGVSLGSVTISAVSGSITGTGPLTVTAATISSIAVTPATDSVAKGVSVQYKAVATYTDSTTADITKTATWASSATNIATISNASGSNGLASTVGIGSSNITAAASGVTSNSATLTVTAATLNSVAVTPATDSIANGTSLHYTATGTYSDGSTKDLTTLVTWSSGTTATATISNQSGSNGLATSVAPGTTVITATNAANANGAGSTALTGTANLTVTQASLSTIAVTPANASVPAGYLQQYKAEGTYADGSTSDITSQVTWSTLSSSVATISSSGQLTAVAAGSTTVVASMPGTSKSSSVKVTVVNTTLKTITVTPATATTSMGSTQQFTATGNFVDASNNTSTFDLTTQVTWSSSNSNAAKISSTGLATGGSLPGSTTISATHGTVTGTATLTNSL